MTAHVHGPAGPTALILLSAPLAVAAILYCAAAADQSRRGRPWPWRRTVAWIAGLTVAAVALTGLHGTGAPFADHAVAHVMIGMVAPLLLVGAAPTTLALRTLAVTPARRLSRALRSRPARFVGHPMTAALLSVGSLWGLHLTGMSVALSGSLVGHTVMMLHFLVAGSVFTAAIAPVDPSPHRSSVRLRAVVLVAAAAAHGILAKLLYVQPPPGVAADDARAGALIMFYAGDVVDLALMLLLCAQWYRERGRAAVRPARAVALGGAA